MSASVQDTRRSLGHSYGQHPPDHEWISFSARFNHLLDPDKPLRNHETINYPSKEASVFAVHSGYLERKTRFTRAYCEKYFVLTPSGFLHEYSSSNPAQATSPLFSLFLPLCTLGPAAISSPKITQVPPSRRPLGWCGIDQDRIASHRPPFPACMELPFTCTMS